MSNPAADLADDTTDAGDLTAVARGRRIISLGMVAAGALYLVASLQLDRGELAQPGPGLYPILVGGLMILSGLGGLLELARGHVGASGETIAHGHRHWIFLAAMCLGVALLPTLGYFVSAAVCGAAVSWAAGQKTLWKAAVTGLGIAVVTSILFISVLGVYLPGSVIDGMFG